MQDELQLAIIAGWNLLPHFTAIYEIAKLLEGGATVKRTLTPFLDTLWSDLLLLFNI
jgi:hypothetical protein